MNTHFAELSLASVASGPQPVSPCGVLLLAYCSSFALDPLFSFCVLVVLTVLTSLFFHDKIVSLTNLRELFWLNCILGLLLSPHGDVGPKG